MSGTNHAAAQPLQLDPNAHSGGVGEYLLHRAKPYLPPWLLAGGVGILSLPAHLAWGGSAAASAGLTLASVGLTAATWWAGKPTTQQRRLHSAITVAAGTGWFTAAALAGPAAGPLGSLYFIGGSALAATWNVRQLLRVNPEGGAGSADKGLLEKVGLAKTMVTGGSVAPNKATFDLQLPPGELTPDDVAKALPRLAGAFKVAKNAVRMTPDADDSSRATLTVVPNDLLKAGAPHPGPSHPGGSIADPVVVGIYEDGTPMVLFFPGDPEEGRNAMHLLGMGMTGSGKSEGCITALSEVITRRDVIVWASDPAKAEQTLGPLLPAIDWAALDMTSTKAMVEALKAVIPARTSWLAKYGYKQWEPACAEVQADGSPGMPYLIAWFEEAAKTIRETDDDVFTGIAQEARSAGLSLVVSLQRASGSQMSTDTRASLGSSWVFGLRDERDAGFALPDEALDAGAAPHAWKDKKPGYSYLVANGVPETFWATPGRAFLTPADYTAWAVTEFADVRAVCDPVTGNAAARAIGGAFLQRTRYPIPDQPGHQDGPDEWDDEDEQPLYLDPDQDDEDGDDVGWIDPQAELPPVQTIVRLGAPPQGPPARKLNQHEARQAMTEILAEFESEGRTDVGPADFMEHCDRFNRSRQWVSGQVADMVLLGRLRETDRAGRYEIVPQDHAAA
ncbi:plasmid transfer protein TraB [Streptomyces sp. NRRL B-24484]|uniref:plasmid transfer protein TraB n=1 Tax=Streptomyces sp. NRRL B-24484 TaxID=1463833 RepID=UPI0005BD2D78|nr:plasmid transfer protein TraB [Streptomyces sp. NRRL B-24484]